MIKKIALWLVLAAGTALLAQHVLVFRPGVLERVGALVAHPFLLVSNKIGSSIRDMRAKKIAYSALEKKMIFLQGRYDDLFAAYVDLRATTRFGDGIQELVDFRQRYNFDAAILGKVLARTINANEHVVILNRGSASGVRNDMVAIYKLQIIGRVIECYPTMCKVMLMTDKRCKIAGFTNATGAGGIVVGTNELNRCDMMFVSHLSDIVDEDFVFSSGQGLVFPEGFCLGKIIAHSQKDGDLYHALTIEPLVDFEDLRYCLLASQEMINLF